MVLIMIPALILIALLDTYKDIQKKEYRKLAVYYSVIAISAVIGTLAILGFEVPSPAKSIEHIIHGIMGI